MSRYLRSLHLRRVFIMLTSVAILSVSAMGAWQNIAAQNDVNSAQALDKSGDYQEASTLIKSVDSPLLLPSVKGEVQTESQKNKSWLSLLERQYSAEQMIKAGKYNDALAALDQIPKDFPTYAAVQRDILQVQSAIAAAQKHAADIAAQQAASAAQAASKARQSAQNPTSTQLSCTPTTPLKGKRFVSTSTYSAVLGASSITQVAQILQTFFDQYSVHVEVASVSPSSAASKVVTYQLVADSDLCAFKVYGATMIDEWSKYPVDWIRATKLKDMIFVTTLTVSGQTRAAMPDVGGWDMYYDVRYSGDYAREVIHHEFDHLLTASYFGTYWPSDPTWQSYNPTGFSYGNGGSSCYVNLGSCPSTLHPVPGFVDFYATTDIAEDKAELYAYLMTDTYHHQLNDWVTSDSNLANKVNDYKQFIASHSPEMSGSYFEDINP